MCVKIEFNSKFIKKQQQQRSKIDKEKSIIYID